jgi:hypothetical protein
VLHHEVVAPSGFPVQLTITCPRTEFKYVPARLTVDLPADLREQGLWLWMMLEPNYKSYGDYHWRDRRSEVNSWALLVDSEGNCFQTSVFTDYSLDRRYSPAGYPPDLMEYLLLGKSEESVPKNYADSIDVYYKGLQEFKVSNSRSLKHTFEIFASTKGPVKQLELPELGVAVSGLLVVQKVPLNERFATEEGDSDVVQFRRILSFFSATHLLENTRHDPRIGPDDWIYQQYPRIGPEGWNYRPSDQIVELIRYRLEQLNKTEAGEVSARMN